MIIIAGDSWGCGELPEMNTRLDHFDYYNLVGLGLYLQDSGRDVINCSVPGGSNLLALQELTSTLHKITLQGRLTDVTHVFIFQTEWYRDFRIFAPNLAGFIDLKNPYYIPTNFDQNFVLSLISRWQYRLAELARAHNLRIGVIGGCSDTIWLSKFEEEYPGLYIACQSFTNLCISNNDKIDNPVFAVTPDPNFIELCKKYDIEFLLSQLDLGKERKAQWRNHPEWFWPDGNHANAAAHRKLYEFLEIDV